MKYKIFIFEVSDERNYKFVKEVEFRKEDLSTQDTAYEFLDKIEIPVLKFESEQLDILKG